MVTVIAGTMLCLHYGNGNGVSDPPIHLAPWEL